MTKKKILLLSDDIRLHSGIGTMSKEIVMGTLHKYDWVQLAGAIKHPDAGKGFVDLSRDENIMRESGVKDGYLKIFPVDGYGNAEILKEIIEIEKPDMIMHFTDPRFWGWLYDIGHDIRKSIPISYYNIWDDLPFPHWNEPFYESCDLLMAISKQTYNINKHVCQIKPRNDWSLTYVQHGIDENKYFPVDDMNPEIIGLLSQFAPDKDYEFIAFFNSRNIRRKGVSDLIQAFGEFQSSLSKEEQEKVLLLLHTDVVDENGTNLDAVSKLYPDINIIFSNAKLPHDKLNILYNMSDVTCNPSSAEGFGLSHMESMMAGTPTIATVTGGLQDQMGFKVDGEELSVEHLTAKIPSNSTGKISKDHGPWTYPLWPNQSLQGSPPTPYIYDSRPVVRDIISGLKYWHNMTREERKIKGKIGRDWAIENGFTAKGMCAEVINSFENCFENWKPLENFEIINTNEVEPNYPSGVLI